MTRINAEEYTHGHEISKLLGSPPGYVGQHLEPLLSQARIDEPHCRLREETGPGIGDEPPLVDRIFPVEANKFHSLILFDEIEKAHPVVWNALLGILEDGRLTLGNNTTTDFTRSIILMTSNVGSREMSALLERRPVGFDRADEMEPQDAEASLEQTALSAARATFPLEFLNRFDETLVYSALTREDLERILDKFLSEVHIRAMKQAGVPLLLKLTGEARRYLIDKGSDLRYGARPLRRAVERELVDPVSRLIAARSVRPGDVVEVRREGDRLAFYRQSRSVTGVVA